MHNILVWFLLNLTDLTLAISYLFSNYLHQEGSIEPPSIVAFTCFFSSSLHVTTAEPWQSSICGDCDKKGCSRIVIWWRVLEVQWNWPRIPQYARSRWSQGPNKHDLSRGVFTQNTFKEYALVLVHTISGMGNLFLDDTHKHEMWLTVVSQWWTQSVESVGRDQYNKYLKIVIRDHRHSIHEPIT